MSHKIIFPEGIELIEYLNRGYAICNEWEIDEMEYEYERDEDVDERGDDIPPAGCRACGGPYPNCKLSCKLFDD